MRAAIEVTESPAELETRLLRESQDFYEDALTELRVKLPTIIENQGFFQGIQWGVATSQALYPYQSTLDDRERPMAANYVRPTVRSAVATKLRNSVPNPSVVPSASDIRARVRAERADRFCRSSMRNGIFRYEELFRAVLGS